VIKKPNQMDLMANRFEAIKETEKCISMRLHDIRNGKTGLCYLDIGKGD